MAGLEFLLGKKDPESLFLSHLKWVERTAVFVARKHGYGSEDADDFCSHTKIKLLEDDYAVFRKFRSRSSLRLYLKTVIHRLYIDYEIAQRGKWRPSTTAQNLGPVAVQLEELLHWKHHSFEEAFEILNTRHGGTVHRNDLLDIAGKLPKRWGRTTIQFVPLSRSSDPEATAGKGSDGSQGSETARVLGDVLSQAISQLSGSDRLMLRMRFQDDFTFEEIARFVKKKKMQVYGRLRKILADLQEELVSQGISTTEVQEVLNFEAKNLDFDFLQGE